MSTTIRTGFRISDVITPSALVPTNALLVSRDLTERQIADVLIDAETIIESRKTRVTLTPRFIGGFGKMCRNIKMLFNFEPLANSPPGFKQFDASGGGGL